MENEFPGVVDLNVNGTHYTTLLATLTKDEDSKLAAMFTGQLPVYKDRDGRYFVEANGSTFKVILYYLVYDELPMLSNGGWGQRLTAGFGTGRRLFADTHSSVQYSSRDVELLYKDALNLGLTQLARELEQFQPNFVKLKMDAYRKTHPGYDACLAKVLDIIPPEAVFHGYEFNIRIKKDFQTIEEGKCCEHECRIAPWSSALGHSYSAAVDAEVRIAMEIDPTLLSVLSFDFGQRGFAVQGRVAECDFICQKENRQKSSFVFLQKRQITCCQEVLYILNFSLATDLDTGTRPFHFKQNGQSSGFNFGQPQLSNESSQGSFKFQSQQKSESSLFGQPNTTAFRFGGQNQTDASSGLTFGGQVQEPSGFVGFCAQNQPRQGGLFGGLKPTGSGYNVTVQQPTPPAFSFGSAFGSQQQQGREGGIFGDGSQSKGVGGFGQSTGGFGLGTAGVGGNTGGFGGGTGGFGLGTGSFGQGTGGFGGCTSGSGQSTFSFGSSVQQQTQSDSGFIGFQQASPKHQPQPGQKPFSFALGGAVQQTSAQGTQSTGTGYFGMSSQTTPFGQTPVGMSIFGSKKPSLQNQANNPTPLNTTISNQNLLPHGKGAATVSKTKESITIFSGKPLIRAPVFGAPTSSEIKFGTPTSSEIKIGPTNTAIQNSNNVDTNSEADG